MTVITRRGMFGLIAVALAPQWPVLALDGRVKRRAVILREEVFDDPGWFGLVYRAVVDFDGLTVYGTAVVTAASWQNLVTREMIRAEVLTMVELELANRTPVNLERA